MSTRRFITAVVALFAGLGFQGCIGTRGPVPGEEDPYLVEDCSNAIDDDGDGAVDCADAQCLADPACAGPSEVCGNGLDDDGDGLADCADPACGATAFCADPCLADPTLPGCADPEAGAKFGVGGNQGGWRTGPAPACDPSSPFHVAPPPDFSGSGTVITGGTGLYSGSVIGGTLSKIAVRFVELTGYYEVPLGGSSFAFTISFAQSLAVTNVTMQLVPFGIDGEVGQCFEYPVQILPVGGGELQISLTFDMPDDLDLHVVEPDGTEIYYGDRNSPSGGALDLDSNPACSQDFVNAENVTYDGVTPPSGTYTVRVAYWSDCSLGSGPVSYVVTVTKGGVVTTYPGSFADGSDTGGGLGAGVSVATFTYP